MYQSYKVLDRIVMNRRSTFDNSCAIHTDITTYPWINFGECTFHPGNWHHLLRFLKNVDETTAHRHYTDATNKTIYISAHNGRSVRISNENEVLTTISLYRFKKLIERLEKCIQKLGLK